MTENLYSYLQPIADMWNYLESWKGTHDIKFRHEITFILRDLK